MAAKQFSLRGLTTMIVVLSFLVLTVTGVALYIAPSRWLAVQSDWRFLGLDKMRLVALHIIASLTFLVVAVLHLGYNWRTFKHFLRARAQEGTLGLRWEFPLALAVVAVVSIGAALEWTPFKQIVAFSQEMRGPGKGSPEGGPGTGQGQGRGPAMQGAQAPQGTASLGGAAALQTAPAGGAARASKPPAAIAGNAGTAPRAATGAQPRPAPRTHAAVQARRPPMPRWGRMSLEAVCRKRGAAIDQVLEELESMGIKAQPADKVKDLADAAGLTPLALVERLMPQVSPGAGVVQNGAAPPSTNRNAPPQ